MSRRRFPVKDPDSVLDINVYRKSSPNMMQRPDKTNEGEQQCDARNTDML